MNGIFASIAREAAAYLRDGFSVNLAGMRFSGRTTLIDSVAADLTDQGFSIVRLAGVSLLQDQPLSALAAAGIELPRGGSAIGAAVLAVGQRLSQKAVLVIDDADDLDPSSAGVVIAAHRKRRFPVLVVTRTHEIGHGMKSELAYGIQPVVRLRLRPMDLNEVHVMVREMLPGTVSPSTIARIATFTGGLPGLVRTVVEASVRNGALTNDDGIWHASRTLYSPQLGDVIEPLLRGLSDRALTALTEIAMVGSVSDAEATKLIDRKQIAALEDLGLLRVVSDLSAPIVGVFPVAVAEYLLQESSVAQRSWAFRRLRRAGVGDVAKRVQRAREPKADHQNASVISTHIREHWRAESGVLRAAWLADPVPARALPLLRALNYAGAPFEEHLDVTARTRPTKDIWHARMLEWEATDRALRLGDLAGAVAAMDEATAEMPAFRHLFWHTKMNVTFVLDHVPDLAESATLDVIDPLAARVVKVAQVDTGIAQGRLRDALALLDASDPEAPTYLEHGSVHRGLTYLLLGRLDDAVEWSTRELGTAQKTLEPGLIQAHTFVGSFALALMGRFRDVRVLTSSALSLMGRSTIYEPFHGALITLAALAASWEGRTDFATGLADQAHNMGTMGPYPLMVAKIAPALVYQNTPEATRTLWEAVDDRLDRGYYTAALFIAAAAVEREPDLDRATRVNALAQHMQSEFMRALGRYTLAVSQSDVPILRQAVSEFADMKSHVHAARAGMRLAIVLRSQGEFKDAAHVATEMWRLLRGSTPGMRQVLHLPLVEDVDLSERESEIARLIARGSVPFEIGNDLDLSVRTVENHIASIYRKVGVNSRQQLRAALSTWLSGVVKDNA
ncbi:MAG: helix-turn-helix transcriptional regulator [Propionibacteriaceae bacterium]|jgi:DNA-binding CsgD family transcriptional regulator|nr:helix-turn-helix transcriptional regulator [Propionibacteriaceae bacterium]